MVLLKKATLNVAKIRLIFTKNDIMSQYTVARLDDGCSRMQPTHQDSRVQVSYHLHSEKIPLSRYLIREARFVTARQIIVLPSYF